MQGGDRREENVEDHSGEFGVSDWMGSITEKEKRRGGSGPSP